MKRISERTIIFNNLRFTRPQGKKYYRNTKVGMDLHRYIYKFYNGDIEKGFHIHHIDGDTENNNIENLLKIDGTIHLIEHNKNLTSERLEALKKHCEVIRPKTKEWHASDAGKQWHKEHYQNVKDRLHVEKEFKCIECGKTYLSKKHESKFCSNSCKSKHRRKSGVDNEKRLCKKCGEEFITNKYSKVIYCSRRCSKLK
mgnify:CR=1 FL=1